MRDLLDPYRNNGLQHFVITRFGFCVYDEQALSDGLDLFEAVTLPSLLNQSSGAFTCLVAIDAQMPGPARARLAAMLAPHARLDVVPINVTALVQVRQGCFDWVWEACQNHLLSHRAVTDPDSYVVTSILDADDAWHRDVVSIVNRSMSEHLERLLAARGDRGTWLQHTNGIAATFNEGYSWFIGPDTWQKVSQPFMSMAVFVLARFSSGISACSSRHLAWPAYCEVLAFESCVLEQKQPMWAWVRHEGSTQPWVEPRKPASDAFRSSERCRLFGLDPERVAAWRERHRSAERPGSRRTYAGASASERFDRVFRIAGLNRQIDALLAARGPAESDAPSEAGAIDDTIAQVRVKREALVELLRSDRGGRTLEGRNTDRL